MKKIILFLILFAFIASQSTLKSQSNLNTDKQLLIKYWKYRYRLRYFVVNNDVDDPTTTKGFANVSPTRNVDVSDWRHYPSTDFLCFGQQLSAMGYYIGVLATEYKLLNSRGLGADAEKTLAQLYNALLSLKRLDMCETEYPWGTAFGGSHTTDDWDGYLNRNDVPWNFLTTNNAKNSNALNDGINPSDIDPIQHPGDPAYINNISSSDPYCYDNINDPTYNFHEQGEISRDEITKLYIGLALVVKCVPSSEYELINLTKDITRKIYLHIAEENFVISNPDGDPVGKGADMAEMSWGFFGATNYICGPHPDILMNPPNVDLAPPLWNALQFFNPNSNIDHLSCSFAAIADNWTTFSVPSTGMGINTVSARHNWDTFYLTLWKFLHDENNYEDIQQKTLDQLIAAPCEGPYKFDCCAPTGGWATNAKYQMSCDEQNNGESSGFGGNYNGLDYMLMYNLYSLVFGTSFYTEYIEPNLGGVFPIVDQFAHTPNPIILEIGSVNHPGQINAFKSITSYQQIKNTVQITHHETTGQTWSGETLNMCADITYKAEKVIKLEPGSSLQSIGFKVELGAKFHAKIEKQLCDLSSTDVSSTDIYNKSEQWYTGDYLSPQFQENQERKSNIINAEELSVKKNQSCLYPNPFNENIYISNEQYYNCNYEVFDVSNNLICSGKLKTQNSFSQLNSGMYFMKIYYNNDIIVQKIIKL